jgi:cytochrome b561
MSLRNTATSYGSVAKFFHWLVSALIVLMLIFGYLLDDIPKDYQPAAYNLHKLTGLTILALMLLRLVWTLINPKPVLPADTMPWERLSERLVHFMFYFFAILMPLAGWVGAVAARKPPHLGNFNFELPIPQDKVLAHAAFDVHGIVAIVLIVLISIHVLAALYHHFIRKDNILMRMLPNRSLR